MKSKKEYLEKIFGSFQYMPRSNNIFAFVKVTERVVFNGEAKGQLHEVAIDLDTEYNLNESRPE
jgi:hypothetical protein